MLVAQLQRVCASRSPHRWSVTHPRSLLEAITRNQSRTLCFFRYFFVRYLRYLRPWCRNVIGLAMLVHNV